MICLSLGGRGSLYKEEANSKVVDMFNTKTKTPAEWRFISSALSALFEEATFEANADGLTFRGMDPSHVALLDLNWPKEAFEKYECDKEQKLTVRVEDFSKVLKRAGNKDSVTIKATDSDMLKLEFNNGLSRNFEIHLIEGSYSAQPLPKLTLDNSITLPLETFADIAEDINTLCDHITIAIAKEKEEVIISGKSDSGEAKIPLAKGLGMLSDLKIKGDSSSTYLLEFVMKLLRSPLPSEELTIQYSSKMPIMLERKFAEGAFARFYLAPRIESS